VSNLESLVKSRLNAKRAVSVNRLTVRLDHERHEKLKSMADAFNLSKTATAEDLLAVAVDDAYVLYLDTLEPEDRLDEENELERAINDRYIEDDEDMQRTVVETRAEIEANQAGQQRIIQRLIADGVEVVKE
jgi:hypothetical protein